jgi:hypothetical protein
MRWHRLGPGSGRAYRNTGGVVTGPADRVGTLLRARQFIRAHGQVPRTEDLSANPGEAAWQLLAQVLDVAEAGLREQAGRHGPGTGAAPGTPGGGS